MALYNLLGKVLYPILLPVMRPFLRRSERVYGAVLYNGQVLLVKNWLARDTWRLPGGGKRKNESAVDSLRREIKEELGLELTPDACIQIKTTVYTTDNLGFKAIWFYCILDELPRIQPARQELTSLMWTNTIPDDTSPEISDVLTQLMSLKMIY